MEMPTVEQHFDGKPEMRKIFDRLVTMAEKFGAVEQDPKKTSIHLNRKTAFAGIAVRKDHIVLTIKSDRAIKSARIFRSQQTSPKRFHHEVIRKPFLSRCRFSLRKPKSAARWVCFFVWTASSG